MTGLSQLELDKFCISEEAQSDDSEDSPIGNALLARKRQISSASAREVVFADVPCPPLEIFADAAKGGLSQADLDEMMVEAQPTEDNVPTSPLGDALRSVKNRRRWASAKVVEVDVAEEASSFKDSFPKLLCPPSWGAAGIGFSQADLDEVCSGEIDGDVLPNAGYTIQVQPPLAPVALRVAPGGAIGSPVPASPLRRRADAENMGKSPFNCSVNSVSPDLNKAKFGSPLQASPVRRRRASRRADAENMCHQSSLNSNEDSVSVSRQDSLNSPGKVKDMTSSGVLQMLSPKRRSTLSPAVCPLSPVGL